MCAANYWILRLLFVAVRSERRPSRIDTPFEMRPGKAGGNYRLDRLFVHECGCMAALAIRAETAKPAAQMRLVRMRPHRGERGNGACLKPWSDVIGDPIKSPS